MKRLFDESEKMVTRFPPEPNGYLHLGHAKSICLNFGLAEEHNSTCHLRFDDTNPSTENVEYVESIKNDIKWLGFDWKEKLFFASDYYEMFYEFCIKLIKNNKAYVCSLSEEDISLYRGTISSAGVDSPYKSRSIDENLDLLERMRAGEFPNGAHVVRLKIDMSNPNMKMRDPLIYRIRHIAHYRRNNDWCLYPLYDFAHCLSDWKEGITHSICTLEFENNRELYDWILNACELNNLPKQIEFARLNVTHMAMSKRKLLELVNNEIVSGWDDPRLPTLAGLRRRGYTPEIIREFSNTIGVAKNNSTVEIELLEHIARKNLSNSPVVMCVLDPIKVYIDNFINPNTSIEVFIERDDFMEIPIKGYHRLFPGGKVRLKNLGVISCSSVKKNEDGSINKIVAHLEPESKVKGTIHWVDVKNHLNVEVRLYDHLFDHDGSTMNTNSLKVVSAKISTDLVNAEVGTRFQFMRLGYFIVDKDSTHRKTLVFNRTVTLKDSWSNKK
jgi:glutaminyl-tRNA synthetase